MTSPMSGPRHGSGVRPADCHAERPAGPAVEPDGAATAVGRRVQLVGVRVAVEHPLGQRVGGEDDLASAPAAPRSASRTAVARNARHSGRSCHDSTQSTPCRGRPRSRSTYSPTEPAL